MHSFQSQLISSWSPKRDPRQNKRLELLSSFPTLSSLDVILLGQVHYPSLVRYCRAILGLPGALLSSSGWLRESELLSRQMGFEARLLGGFLSYRMIGECVAPSSTERLSGWHATHKRSPRNLSPAAIGHLYSASTPHTV